MFRHLTRGRNEKVQIRNIKSADYPQKGCKEMWIPSVVKTNCTQSGHIVAVRSTSMDNPSRLDNSRPGLQVPYLNLAKGRNGQSMSPFRVQGFAPFNITDNFSYKASSNRYLLQTSQLSFFMVVSYSSPLIFSDNVTVGITAQSSVLRNIIPRNAMAKQSSHGNPELTYDAIKFRGMILYNSSGGVKTGVTIRSRNRYLTRSQFKHYQTLDVFVGIDLISRLSSPRIIHNLMDIHGAINYAFSSTNENTNASWLLNQKTQYGRKTVPIRMIY